MKFKSDIEVQAGLKDSSGAAGTSGQVLSSDGTAVSWIDAEIGVARDVQNRVKASVAISKGQAVYVTGADGTNIIVGLASNTSEATSSKTLGLLNATVSTNGFADVVQIGKLTGLNTIGANAGDPVWLGTNGNLIYGLANKPYAPAHLVYIGVVTRVNASNGEIFVTVQNGFELDELHNVSARTPSNNDGIFYNTSTSLWEAKSISTALGYTPADQAITISTTAPLSGGGNLSANRTLSIEQAGPITSGFLSYNDWNKFNNSTPAGIPNTGDYVFFNGSGLAYRTFLTTAPLSFSVSTGTFSISQAGTSTNGYLNSTDWNTFNNKISGSGTTNYIPKFTGSTALGNSLIYDSGTNVGIGTPTPSEKLEVNGNIRISKSDARAIGGDINGRFITANSDFTSYINFWGSSSSYAKAMELNSGNYISFNSGSSFLERMRITSSGNVGIGTTSPGTTTTNTLLGFVNGSNIQARTIVPQLAFSSNVDGDWFSAKYKVNGFASQMVFDGNGGTTQFNIAASGTAGNSISWIEAMKIISNGNVGIGATPDNGKLTILKATSRATASSYGISIQSNVNNAYTELLLGADDAVDCGIIQTAAKNTNFTGKKLALQPQGGNVGIGTTSPAQKLDVFGTSRISATTPTQEFFSTGNGDVWGSIKAEASTGTGGQLVFSTKRNGNTEVARVRITENGNTLFYPPNFLPVAISGIGAPYYGSNITLASDVGSTQSANRIWSRYDGTGRAALTFETATNTQSYQSDPTGLTYTEYMRITGLGNVGIGTTSPTSKLQVNGGDVGITSGVVSSVGWQSNGLNFTTASSIYNGIYSPSDSVISASTSGLERMRITSAGKVGIGTTNPQYTFSVLSSNNVTWLEDTSGASGAVFALFSAPGNTGIGSIARVGTTSAIAYNSTSDYRLKEDLKEVNGLDKISKIKIYDFKWKNHTDRMDGVMAHELQEVVPYAVTGEKDGKNMQSVDYSKLVPILVSSIQELKAEIEILKNK